MRAADNRLRALVQRLRSCLGSLTPQSRRLLTMRAGLGASQPRSAQVVARILHLSAQREVLLEQISLIALRTVASSGCGATGIQMTAAPATEQLVAAAPSLAPASVATAQPTSTTLRVATRAHTPRHRAKSGRGVLAANAARSHATRYERAATGGGQVPAGLLALVAVLLVAPLLVWPAGRRRLLAAPARLAAISGPQTKRRAPAPSPLLLAPPAVRLRPHPVPPAVRPAPPHTAGPPERKTVDPWRLATDVEAASRPDPQPAAQKKLPSVPSAPATQGAQPRSADLPGRGWIREHATQTALVLTAVGGIIARGIGRSGRHRRRR